MIIGKIAPNRGFEDAVETFRLIRKMRPGAKLLIVGKGSYRGAIEEFSRANGTADDVIWAGYQDGGLVPHFRAMNVLGKMSPYPRVVNIQTPLWALTIFRTRLSRERHLPEFRDGVWGAMFDSRKVVDMAWTLRSNASAGAIWPRW